MSLSHSVNIEGTQKPTWNLVVLLAITLGLEAITDFSGCAVEEDPDIEFEMLIACKRACGGQMGRLTVGSCECE